jgi:hypothetical protein
MHLGRLLGIIFVTVVVVVIIIVVIIVIIEAMRPRWGNVGHLHGHLVPGKGRRCDRSARLP